MRRLHGRLHEFQKEAEGAQVAISRHHVKIGFDEFEYGIYKRRLLEGQPEDTDDWKTGHPMVFPTILAVGNVSDALRMHAFQIRVPMDDTHTLHLWYHVIAPPPDLEIPEHLANAVHTYDVPYQDERGQYLLDSIHAQDIMAWITQGPIADRSLEALGTTDRGVTTYRNMLRRELKRVENGEDPMNVFRDADAIGSRIDLEPKIGSRMTFGGGRELFHKGYYQDDADRYGPATELAANLMQRAEEAHAQSS